MGCGIFKNFLNFYPDSGSVILVSIQGSSKAIIEPLSLAGLGSAYLGLAWLGPWLEARPEQH
jgi:hypothetical protein